MILTSIVIFVLFFLLLLIISGEFTRTALPYEGTGAGPAVSKLARINAGDGDNNDNNNNNDGGGGSGGVLEGISRGERLLGSQSSVYTFTKAFRDLASELSEEIITESETETASSGSGGSDKELLVGGVAAQALITVDGGPHTLWW